MIFSKWKPNDFRQQKEFSKNKSCKVKFQRHGTDTFSKLCQPQQKSWHIKFLLCKRSLYLETTGNPRNSSASQSFPQVRSLRCVIPTAGLLKVFVFKPQCKQQGCSRDSYNTVYFHAYCCRSTSQTKAMVGFILIDVWWNSRWKTWSITLDSCSFRYHRVRHLKSTWSQGYFSLLGE